MASPPQLAHVVYGTHQFNEMIEFYSVAFGDRVRMNNGRHAFLSYDHEHHRHALVNLGPRDGREEPESSSYSSRPGVRHVAYAWSDIPTLMDVYVRMRDSLGVKPVKCVKHGPSLSMYYEDPDGNRSEFYVDVMTTEDAIEYMGSEVFVADPVGDPFDPEEICDRLAAGRGIADLVARSTPTHDS